MWQPSEPGARAELVQDSLVRWQVQMAPRQGTVIHSRTPRPVKTCTEDSQQRSFTHFLCQIRARGHMSKKCEWNPRHCHWLETGSRPEEPTHISTRDLRDQPETRHGYVVTFNQTRSLGWTDSTMERENLGELRKKTHKLSGPHRELCWKRLEGMVFSSGSRLQRISRTVTVAHFHYYWTISKESLIGYCPRNRRRLTVD